MQQGALPPNCAHHSPPQPTIGWQDRAHVPGPQATIPGPKASVTPHTCSKYTFHNVGARGGVGGPAQPVPWALAEPAHQWVSPPTKPPVSPDKGFNFKKM